MRKADDQRRVAPVHASARRAGCAHAASPAIDGSATPATASATAPERTSAMAACMSGWKCRSSSRWGTRSAQQRAHGLQRRAGGERRVEVAALRGGQQLDADHGHGVLDHGQQPARAVRRHRDVVLLVGGGGDGIDAGRVGPLLVLRDERRGRHLRDHEARVQPRLRRQEGRQAGQAPGRPAWRCAARRASRSRRRPARSCRRRRPRARRGSCRRRARSSVLREDQRIVGDAVGLGVQQRRRPGAARRGTAPITCGWQRRQ